MHPSTIKLTLPDPALWLLADDARSSAFLYFRRREVTPGIRRDARQRIATARQLRDLIHTPRPSSPSPAPAGSR